jgi:hypothetical protein
MSLNKGFVSLLPMGGDTEEEEVYTFYNEIQFILFGFEFSFMISMKRMPLKKEDTD